MKQVGALIATMSEPTNCMKLQVPELQQIQIEKQLKKNGIMC